MAQTFLSDCGARLQRSSIILHVLLVSVSPLCGAEPSSARSVDARILDRAGRILLSRDGTPLLAAQIRPATETAAKILDLAQAQALLAPEAKDRGTPLPPGGEQMRELAAVLPGRTPADQVSLLLRARRVAAGVRLLVSSTLRGPAYENLAPDETLPAPPAHEFSVQLFPGAEKVLPVLKELNFQREALPPDDVLQRTARALVFETGKDTRLFVLRSAPVEWRVQRLPDCVLLTARLQPDPRESASFGSFVVYFGAGADDAPPEMSPITLDKGVTPAHDMLEGALRVYASGADPYVLASLAVVAEVACPPGPNGDVMVKRLPCFFWQAPSGLPAEGEFRFRFAPPYPGTYGLRIALVAPTGQVRNEALAFEAGPPDSPGMVRVKPDERVFRRDDGGGFMPLGIDLGGGKKSAAAYRYALVAGSRANANSVRLSLNELERAFEPSMGVYDADAAAALDDILRAAQARDIAVLLAVDSGAALSKYSAQHPYFRELGGPLAAPPEFFRNPAAKRLFQNRLTYLAARYGAFRSLFAWELVREIDDAWPVVKNNPEDRNLRASDVDLCRRARRDVQDWANDMALHIAGMDQHEHPICISTGVSAELPWADLEAAENLYFVLHAGACTLSDDPAAKFHAWNDQARQPGRAHKPFALARFTVDVKEGELAPASAMRSAMFASIAGGMAAAPFVMPGEFNALPRKPLQSFAAAVEWLLRREQRDELRLLNEKFSDPAGEVHMLGRAGRHGIAAWLRTKSDQPISQCRLRLPPLVEGHYSVAWMDATSGEIVKSDVYKAPPKQVDKPLEPFELTAPQFKRELLLLIGPAD